jgi:hypothetical protein
MKNVITSFLAWAAFVLSVLSVAVIVLGLGWVIVDPVGSGVIQPGEKLTLGRILSDSLFWGILFGISSRLAVPSLVFGTIAMVAKCRRRWPAKYALIISVVMLIMTVLHILIKIFFQ